MRCADIRSKTVFGAAAIIALAWIALAFAATPAFADETRYVDASAGLLQEGGLIQPAAKLDQDGQGQGRSGLQAQAQGDLDHDGIFEVLEDAVQAWDGEDDTVEVNISAFSIPLAKVPSTFNAFVNAHEQYFYLSKSYSYSYWGSTARTITLSFNTAYGNSEIEAFQARVAKILSGVESGWSDEQKALYLHDYLVSHCEYDKTYTRSNSYDALVEGSAVCQGYTLAYNYLLSCAGIDSVVVSSAENDHAWNLVTIDGVQYYVDCTDDDPSNVRTASYVGHGSFLRSRDGFEASSVNHGTTNQDWLDAKGNYVYQAGVAVESTKYDNYYWSGCKTVIPHVGDLWAYSTDDLKICVHDYATGTDRELTTVEHWLVMGSDSYHYLTNYASLASTGADFVLAESSAVSLLSPAGKKTVVRTLTDDERARGYLYSLLYNDETGLFDCGYFPDANSEMAGSFSIDLAIRVDSVSLDSAELGGKAGDRLQLSATVLPASSLNKAIVWSVDDGSVASVDAGGLLVLQKPGTTVLTVTSYDNPAASASATITVRPHQIEEADVSLVDADGFAFDGKPHEPDVRVACEGQVLSEGVDYTLAYRDNVNAGMACVTVTGMGNYGGAVSKQYRIAKASIDAPQAADSLVYNGTVQVGVADTAWYGVEGGSAKKAGDYVAIASLSDAENYCWADGTVGDKSIAWSVERAQVWVEAEDVVKTYGDPDPQFSAQTGGIVAGDTVAYDFNREPGEDVGTYDLAVVGAEEQGSYAVDYLAATLTINPANLPSVSLEYDAVEFDGQPKHPGVHLAFQGNLLTEGDDYLVTYDADSVRIGVHEVHVTGTGNFEGSRVLKYRIEAAAPAEEEDEEDEAEVAGPAQGDEAEDGEETGAVDEAEDADQDPGDSSQAESEDVLGNKPDVSEEPGNAAPTEGLDNVESGPVTEGSGDKKDASGDAKSEAAPDEPGGHGSDGGSIGREPGVGTAVEPSSGEQAGAGEPALELPGESQGAGQGAGQNENPDASQVGGSNAGSPEAGGPSSGSPSSGQAGGGSADQGPLAAPSKGLPASGAAAPEPTPVAAPAVGSSVVAGDGPTAGIYTIAAPGEAIYVGTLVSSGTAVVPEAIVASSGQAYVVTSVAASAFAGRTGLKSVTIGSHVKSIGKAAFQGCTALASVKGGKGVATIGASAFQGCTKLKSFTFGAKVKSIGKKAFFKCKKLAKLTFKGANLKKVGSSAFKKTAAKSVVKAPKAKKAAYKKLLKKAGLSKKAKYK